MTMFLVSRASADIRLALVESVCKEAKAYLGLGMPVFAIPAPLEQEVTDEAQREGVVLDQDTEDAIVHRQAKIAKLFLESMGFVPFGLKSEFFYRTS